MLALIVLVRVGQVQNSSCATSTIENIPVDGNPSLRTGEAFTCRIWVKDALAVLHEHGEIKLPAHIGKSLKSHREGTGYESDTSLYFRYSREISRTVWNGICCHRRKG